MHSEIYKLHNSKKSDLVNLERKLKDEVLSPYHIETLKTKPWWTDNHTVLQLNLEKICPGTHLVAMPWDSNDVKWLLEGGVLTISGKNNVIFKPMAVSLCHDNCEDLLRSGKIVKYYTGYALSRDRLWRHHSWGISPDNKIIETTQPRIAYLSNHMVSLPIDNHKI